MHSSIFDLIHSRVRFGFTLVVFHLFLNRLVWNTGFPITHVISGNWEEVQQGVCLCMCVCLHGVFTSKWACTRKKRAILYIPHILPGCEIPVRFVEWQIRSVPGWKGLWLWTPTPATHKSLRKSATQPFRRSCLRRKLVLLLLVTANQAHTFIEK